MFLIWGTAISAQLSAFRLYISRKSDGSIANLYSKKQTPHGMPVFVRLRLEGIADGYIVGTTSGNFIIVEFTIEHVVNAKLY